MRPCRRLRMDGGVHAAAPTLPVRRPRKEACVQGRLAGLECFVEGGARAIAESPRAGDADQKATGFRRCSTIERSQILSCVRSVSLLGFELSTSKSSPPSKQASKFLRGPRIRTRGLSLFLEEDDNEFNASELLDN
jgi:hypothetical protein